LILCSAIGVKRDPIPRSIVVSAESGEVPSLTPRGYPPRRSVSEPGWHRRSGRVRIWKNLFTASHRLRDPQKGALNWLDTGRLRKIPEISTSNASPIPWRIVNTPPSPQPPLPARMPDGSEWPERTREWWAMWGRDPRTADHRPTDWAMLLDIGVLHALFWRGNTAVASELRRRVATFGATP
jgi:hypothetical protein